MHSVYFIGIDITASKVEAKSKIFTASTIFKVSKTVMNKETKCGNKQTNKRKTLESFPF